MENQTYILEFLNKGKFQVDSRSVLYALENIRLQMKLSFKEFQKVEIVSAVVIIRNDFAMDITELVKN